MSKSLQSLSRDSEKNQQSLAAAFAFFNETSDQLASSYRTLEQRVHELSEELDSTEAKRKQETQKTYELEQRMQALLDFLPGGVIVLNARGTVVESNPAADKLLGVALEGKVWRHIIAQCFSPKNDDGLEVSTKNGRRLSISTSSLDAEGQIILLTDQTETRALQEHLSRHERLSAMGKMVSALAHQIRTPLSAAILYAGHLSHSEIDPPTQKRFAHKCLDRLQHMEKQVRDMMLFVKSELPLNDICTAYELEQELSAAAEVVIQSSHCECYWVNDAAAVRIKCHKAALVSSLMNLINNATQSADHKLQIHIFFSLQEYNAKSFLRIAISDNGNGMDAETLKKVQEVFTTTKSQGTGLGLAVVRSVAKAHGAQFSLSSKQGVGTIAEICIPLVDDGGNT